MPTILVAVETDVDAELTVRALRSRVVGCDVIVARDGVAALDWILARGAFAGRDPSVQARVAMLDLRLPKLDGLDVLTAIRTNRPTNHLPVVIMACSQEDDEVMRTYSLGANAYLYKPIDSLRFQDDVARVAQFWLEAGAASFEAHG